LYSCSKTNGAILSASLRSGQNYSLQANTNLTSTNWITLTNFVAGTVPIFYFTNHLATNIPLQFYRIVLLNGTLTTVVSPVIQTVWQSGSSFIFTWCATANQVYQIQSNTNLTQPNWTNSGSALMATNSTMTTTVSIGTNKQQFYRVSLVQ